MKSPGVYNIPSRYPFAETLARALLDLAASNPDELARAHVLLPTRRACRALQDAFLRIGGGRAMLLPKMTPLGDVDVDELVLDGFAVDGEGLAIPPAIDPLRRVLLLARQVIAAGGENPASPEQALMLAAELATLIDQSATEGIDLAHLDKLVDNANLSAHWQRTVKFLEIVASHWPGVLAGENAVDPATRRDMALAARASAWRQNPPKGLVIAAGSTGTIPATAGLLQVIANLENGRVVLPGLDTEMDDELWAGLDPGHPQYSMARLLEKIGVGRESVLPMPGTDPAPEPRTRLVAGALVPPAGTGRWRETDFTALAGALDGVTRIDAQSMHEEACAIALVMRQTLETPEKTAALITPDRGLARRVTAELRRWGIRVDDSAGVPLARSAPGAFFELAGKMVAGGFHPVDLLAMLKHPLAGPGEPQGRAAFLAGVRALEVGLLLGPRPAGSLKGLGDAFRLLQRDQRRLKAMKKMGLEPSAIRDVLLLLKDAGDDFVRALNDGDPEKILAEHTRMAERLSGGGKDTPSRLWAGAGGGELSAFIGSLAGNLGIIGRVRSGQWPGLLQELMAAKQVRDTAGAHNRLFIWGLLEARLQRADVTILGGLNEGTWPAEAKASPWMSRPMQKKLGLPLPERRIGLAAHDFCQAFSAPEVYLCRSLRVDGTPQVPSRWLVRLETMLAGNGVENPLSPADGQKWCDWARALNSGGHPAIPVAEPTPRPAVDARPKKFTLSEIETLIRDPYSIYAKKILDLHPLDEIDAAPGASERGIIIHDALEMFLRHNPGALPDDAVSRLLDAGEKSFAELSSSPGVRAFWWPRFERIAEWFAGRELAARARGETPALIEASGEMAIDIGNCQYLIRARADRIDTNGTGGLVLIDYKTGAPPSAPQVASGISPQLALEAAMAKQGAFDGADKEKLAGRDIAALVYIQLSGTRTPGTEKLLKLDPEQVATDAIAGLERLLGKFAQEKTPYLSRPRPMFEQRFGDYDHLARVKEWGAAKGGGE